MISKQHFNCWNMDIPEGYEVKMTGEQEQQQETSNFLGVALLLSNFQQSKSKRDFRNSIFVLALIQGHW